jgi:hypothetical protein
MTTGYRIASGVIPAALITFRQRSVSVRIISVSASGLLAGAASIP